MTAKTIRITGHFGEWLQGRIQPDGPVALVTLPCPELGVTVTYNQSDELTISHDGPTLLDQKRAVYLLRQLRLPTTGQFHISSQMLPGGGAGASTACLIALALSVVARPQSDSEIIDAILATEGASDPLLLEFPDRHLWSSRRAKSLRVFHPVPAAHIVGGFFGPPERTDPTDLDFPDISDLIGQWSAGAENQDLSRLAELSSQSAARTTELRGPRDDPTADIARDLNALGIVRAHTGSARGLVFAPGTVPAHAEAVLQDAGFADVLTFSTGQA